MHTRDEPPSKRRELLMFLLITVVLFPLLSVMLVGAFGFSIWFWQILTGPPGPPGA
ncbi:periplasmic nitrate reductase, NapE protein [Luteimonas sp. JM171]|uniref:periplasmic nitrate reductase, NapE protein n=1 Tax=Luteimonas sp. JM171 TaxID=1896164 RepID=UPI000856DAE3|nr:periplasmic nitrate reductase, NapE protein [Luteimonas sp. JM171]AOH35482.1 nitrate reductase [Luteimonas sp. JM171]